MPLPESKNLPVVEEANASEEVAQLYAKFRETFGRPIVPGILKCFATHPPMLEHMMGLAETMLFCDGALGRAKQGIDRHVCVFGKTNVSTALTAMGHRCARMAGLRNCLRRR